MSYTQQRVLGSLDRYYPFKGIQRTWKDNTQHGGNSTNMPSKEEFKTKLRFDPSRLSTALLKQYLLDYFNGRETNQLLQLLASDEIPLPYGKDPDNLTNYRVLKELGLMSVKKWKNRLEESGNDVEQLYLDDDMVSQDARYFYDAYKVVQEEIGNHEIQMSFFRIISEIVSNLANRNYVEIDADGDAKTIPLAEQFKQETPSAEKTLNEFFHPIKVTTEKHEMEKDDLNMVQMTDVLSFNNQTVAEEAGSDLSDHSDASIVNKTQESLAASLSLDVDGFFEGDLCA